MLKSSSCLHYGLSLAITFGWTTPCPCIYYEDPTTDSRNNFYFVPFVCVAKPCYLLYNRSDPSSFGAKGEKGQASHSHWTPYKSNEQSYHKLRITVQIIFSCKHLAQNIPWSLDISKQEGLCTYNVILRCVRVNIFNVEKEKALQIPSVCL